jgi:hypothetical protein
MATTAQEVFMETVRPLPPLERLRLAAFILQDLTQSGVSVVDKSARWNEQDQNDFIPFSLQYAATLYPEDEDLVESGRWSDHRFSWGHWCQATACCHLILCGVPRITACYRR